jgi:drug/metabolite transporter (DMT)-like permease
MTHARRLRRASLSMLGASLLFAGMVAGIKFASGYGVPVVQMVFYRSAVSFLVTCGWMRLVGMPLSTLHWKAQLWRGVAGFVGMVTSFGSITLLPLSAAVALGYTSPLILAVLLMALYREHTTIRFRLTLIAGFVGVLLLLRPSYDRSQWLGVSLSLGSAACTAVAALNIRSIAQLKEPTARTVAWFSLLMTVGTLPLFLASKPSMLALPALASVAAIALLGTVGQVLLTLAYQQGDTLLVSLLGYSQIVFTTLIGMALWNDHPSLGAWLAILLIIASGAAATAFVQTTPANARREQ